MKTVLNKTGRPLKIALSRGRVLRLGPRKEGQIATQDAERDAVAAPRGGRRHRDLRRRRPLRGGEPVRGWRQHALARTSHTVFRREARRPLARESPPAAPPGAPPSPPGLRAVPRRDSWRVARRGAPCRRDAIIRRAVPGGISRAAPPTRGFRHGLRDREVRDAAPQFTARGACRRRPRCAERGAGRGSGRGLDGSAHARRRSGPAGDLGQRQRHPAGAPPRASRIGRC